MKLSFTTHHTGLYCAQTKAEKENIGVDNNEIERYIDILLRMSIFLVHYYRFYWKLDDLCKPMCQIFSRNCFEIIKHFIYFNDNTKDKK